MKKANEHMQEILDVYAAYGAPPLESVTPETARKLPTLSDAVRGVIGNHFFKRALPFPESVQKIEHQMIDGADGKILARFYYPKNKEGPYPILLYFHGGGWVIANLDTYDSSCRALSNATGYLVISVAYRQAPEHPFPAAPNDAFAAYQWVLSHAREFNGNPYAVAVSGESAGGNLATVICLMAAKKKIAQPIHQLLIYPVTDLTMHGESHHVHADAKPLNEPMMYWFKNHYLKDESLATHPFASPIYAEDFTNIAPATIITAELDPLCSDGEMYAAKLMANHVPVKQRRFNGVGHDFFGAFALLSESKEALQFASEELKHAVSENEAASVTQQTV